MNATSPMPASWTRSPHTAHRAAPPLPAPLPRRTTSATPTSTPNAGPVQGAQTPREQMPPVMRDAFDREMARIAGASAAAPDAPAGGGPPGDGAGMLCPTCEKKLPAPVAGEGAFSVCPYCRKMLPQGEDAAAASRLNAAGRAYAKRIGCDLALFAQRCEVDSAARALYLVS